MPVHELIGRQAELSQIQDMMTKAVGGSGGCLVVEGPAGIGKTSILAAATARGEEIGMRVVAGRATELDQVAPLTTLRRFISINGPCLRPVRDGDGRPDPLTLVDRVGALIEETARTSPLLIVLDDAHRADELTARALRVLVPALAATPVCWLLARRPLSSRPSAQESLDWLIHKGAHRQTVEPLSTEDIAELCARLIGARPDEKVLELAARSGGNPFLLKELVTTSRSARRLVITAGVATVHDESLPTDFVGAVHDRLCDLSPQARQLLDAGSVIARPFSVHEVAALLGRPAMGLLSAVREAMDASILDDSDSALSFRHDLVREALYERLPGSVRRALHREAATLLERNGCCPAEAAEHLLRSGSGGDAHAIEVLRTAVRKLAPVAPCTAADLIMRMLDQLEPLDASRPQLIADAVRLLAAGGRMTEARELGENALHAGLDVNDEAAILFGLSEALHYAGHGHLAIEHVTRLLTELDVPAAARAKLLAIHAHALLEAGEVTAADSAGAEAVAIGSATGDHAALVRGTNARSAVARIRGDLEDAVRFADDAVRIADQVRGEVRHLHPHLWLVPALTAVDRFRDADTGCAMGQREAEQLGTAWSQPLWRYHRAQLRMAAGRLDDAQAEIEAGLRVAEQLGTPARGVPLRAVSALLALERGELEVAAVQIDGAEQLVAGGVGRPCEELAWATASLQEATGHYEAALRTLADRFAELPDHPRLLVCDTRVAAQLVRIVRRAGKRTDLAELAAVAACRLAARNPKVPSFVAAAAHADGLLRENRDQLRAAVAGYRRGPRPLALASALEDAAAAELKGGDRGEAAELLREALRHYESSGARRGATRVHNRLRELGNRRRGRSDPASRGIGWESLTDAELRVARLVAEGLTNREVAARLFLSPHTVDSHLRHSFTKLGVASRVELTRQVIAHDQPAGALAARG